MMGSTLFVPDVTHQSNARTYTPPPPQTLFAITMLALSIALASLLSPLTLSSPLDERWSDTDQYGGKKLIPSNYTVITNVFIQDSPTFKPTGCNLLNDSFGLIDKSAGRWQNFTK
jgi:hypothetical protein